MVGVAQAVDLDELLAASVPISLGLNLVVEGASFEAWAAVSRWRDAALMVVRMEVLDLEAVIVTDLLAESRWG